MAKSVKNKKKKKSTYDDKLIKIIAISVSALIVVIVACALMFSYASSYVAKVDGERIFKYEYDLYLEMAKSEMQEEAVDAGELAEDADATAIAAFWTDEKKAEAAQKALDDVCEWKAEYILAKDEGYGLSYEERNNYKTNLEYQIYSTYQSYSSYYEYDKFVEMYLGTSFDNYAKIAIQDAAIENYKTALKKNYSATDDELKAIYDENPDDYRLITMRALAVQKIVEVEAVEEPENKINEDGTVVDADGNAVEMTDTEKTALESSWIAYEEYLEEKAEYEAAVEETEARLQDMLTQLNEKGTYTEVSDTEAEGEKTDADTDESTEEGPVVESEAEIDGDAETTEEEDRYTDATIAEIIATEGDLFTDLEGIATINAVTSSGYDVLDEYALTMQWIDDSRNSIQSEQKDSEGKDIVADAGGETSEDGVTYTKYVVIDDDDYYYLVRCEGIEDYENSTESEEGAADSIKDNIRTELYEEKAVAELEEKVAAEGSKFDVKKKKQDSIDKIVSELTW